MTEFPILSAEMIAFIKVYDEKSINRVARKHGLDPGNLSRQMTRLESTVGKKLFTRHKNGLEPTAEGERLYRAVNSVQKSFSNELAVNWALEKKVIKIGFHPVIGFSHFSTEMVQKIIDQELQPEFLIAPSADLIEMIKQRKLDFAIVHAPVQFPGVISKSLNSKNLVLCSLSGKLEKNIVLNTEMLGTEKIQGVTNSPTRWVVSDYFLISKMLQKSKGIMGILPESFLTLDPDLKVIKTYPKSGKITALSWPGSTGIELLKCIQKKSL